MPTKITRAFSGQKNFHIPAYSTVTGVKVNGVDTTFTGNFRDVSIANGCAQGDAVEIAFESFRPADSDGIAVFTAYKPIGSGGTAPTPAPAASVGLAMTQLPAQRVYQRSTTTGGAGGKGAGSIAVPITLTAAASSIDYRLRDADATSTTVQDWTSAGTNVAANTTSVTCAGVPAKAQRYLLDLRANGDNAQIVLGTSPVMMGRIVTAAGQSQMVRQFAKASSYAGTLASLGVAVSPYCGVFATYSDGSVPGGGTAAWSLPSDAGPYTSAFAAEFLRRQVETSGVACALAGHSVGATAIAAWAPGTTNNVALRAILDAVGGFEAFYWHQGGDDAGAGTAKATYKTALDGIFADITARNGIRGANYAKLLTAMATRTSGGTGTSATVTAIRQAHREWCAANGGVYLEPHDIVLEDSVHQGQPGNIVLAQHAHRALVTTDAGPTFGTPTRAAGSAIVYVPVSLPTGATTLVLTGNAASRFTVYPAGTLTGALAIASVAYESANTRLALTLSAAPADTQALDVYAFLHPDPSGANAYANMIRDNRTDGDGIAVGRSLEPSTAGPVTVAAPGASAGTQRVPVGTVIWLNTYHNGAGGSGPTPDVRFNNLDQAAYTAPNTLALKDASGAAANLVGSVTTGMNSGNKQATTEGAAPVPASVADTFLFIDSTGSLGNGTSTQGKVSIAGAAISGTVWTVEIYAYRNNKNPRLQSFTIGGVTKSSNVGVSSTAWTATFTDVVPTANEIAMLFSQASGETLGYFGGAKLTCTG